MNYESLHFTVKESRAVCRYARRHRIPYRSKDAFQAKLLDDGFLSGPPDEHRGVHDPAPFSYLVPTDEARRYASWYKSARREHRLTTRRYWITTAIAIVALIVSVISLLQSIGLLDLQRYLRP